MPVVVPNLLHDLQNETGFQGLILTDALIMEGALSENPEVAASKAALAAGCDLLLYPRDFMAVHDGVELWAGESSANRAISSTSL